MFRARGIRVYLAIATTSTFMCVGVGVDVVCGCVGGAGGGGGRFWVVGVGATARCCDISQMVKTLFRTYTLEVYSDLEQITC